MNPGAPGACRPVARGDQFHRKPEAYQLLAKAVTESVLRELGASEGRIP